MSILTLAEVVDWSRAQFAMTAMYHWIFVPLTLGLGFIVAIMHTMYYKRNFDPEWKKITKFWMKIFGINFAVGVATGLILEFEFGTNWSNYSYFVGDIFGAPLAIEGILAFFLEATFIAVMFFGWGKVSPRFHLTSTWLTAVGANISALWIIVANNWMQYPVGMRFNIDTARNEMVNFWEILNGMAQIKFLHTILAGFVLSGVVVVGISAWFMLRKRESCFARRSMWIGSIFGLVSSVLVALTGDISGQHVAKVQPMKFAAMEGLYDGSTNAGLTAFGVLRPAKDLYGDDDVFYFRFDMPGMLSWLAYRDVNAYIPGIKDLVLGNPEQGLLPVTEKIERGKVALTTLKTYSEAKASGDEIALRQIREMFDESTETGKNFKENFFQYFGYGFLERPEDVIPHVPMVFYSFRIMVGFGLWFILLFVLLLVGLKKNWLEQARYRWLLIASVVSVPLAYIAGQAGWIVTEMGRQPWAIQDMLPTMAAVSKLNPGAVKVTFFLFAVLFTVLLIAELMIVFRQIKLGPQPDKKEESDN